MCNDVNPIKTKYKKKIFLRRFHLSRFLAKTLRENKPAMKNADYVGRNPD